MMNGKVILFGMLSVAATCQAVKSEDMAAHVVMQGVVQTMACDVLQPIEVRLAARVLIHVHLWYLGPTITQMLA